MSFLKIFLIWSSAGPFVQQSGIICVVLVKFIMKNNSVNLFKILASGSGGNFVKNSSYLELCRPRVQRSRNIYAILKEGIMGNIHVKLYEIWTSSSGYFV